ncbi:MAG: tetratricopeptide repeat protein [Planctomycetes bacterium]|nr:tetratricopeptide repeat protein [Planctomycetota bacterium]
MPSAEQILRTVLTLLAADGRIGPRERSFLDVVGKSLKVSPQDVETYAAEALQGRTLLALPGGAQARAEFMALLIEATAVDGMITPQERRLLDAVAGKLDWTAAQLDAKLEDALDRFSERIRLELAGKTSSGAADATSRARALASPSASPPASSSGSGAFPAAETVGGKPRATSNPPAGASVGSSGNTTIAMNGEEAGRSGGGGQGVEAPTLPGTIEQDGRGLRARAMLQIAAGAEERGDRKEAKETLEAALALLRESTDRPGLADCLGALGRLHARTGDVAGALSLQEEALLLRRGIGDAAGVATGCFDIAELHRGRGDLSRAVGMYERALLLQQETGDRRGVVATSLALGGTYCFRGEYGTAIQVYTKALEGLEALGDRDGVANAAIELAIVHELRNENTRALQLYEVCEQIKKELGLPLPPTLEPAMRKLRDKQA